MYASIDIGGTNTKIGITSNLNELLDIKRFSTPKSFEELKSQITQILKTDQTYDAIAIGAAGFINRQKKNIYYSPHINYLNNKLASEIIDEITTKEIYLENDASLAALAEANYGDAKNYDRVAYITISTGVGGSLIVNKKIPETHFNFEPGHHIINLETKETFEDLCSGTSFRKSYGASPQDHNEKQVWSKFGINLGYGLNNIILLWRPDIIIIGGSLSKKSNLFIDDTFETLNSLLPLQNYPKIQISKLNDENGILGGLELIKSKLVK